MGIVVVIAGDGFLLWACGKLEVMGGFACIG